MGEVSVYTVLFSFCGLIILSYFFSVLNRITRIPSVLLLLLTGMLLGYLADNFGFSLNMPPAVVEFVGTVGLIMIVLEAGLDLEVTRDKLQLIRSSFLSALTIFIVSAVSVAGILYWWIPQTPFINCLVYAIPLSIVSSAIVLPSVHHLSEEKKEFLIYEASFSDILGIMVFNFFTADTSISGQDVVWFGSSIIVALVLSIGVIFGLMLLLLNNQVNIKFFLTFAVLIVIYVGGKLMHLPSLITILMFGLVINNWELFTWSPLKRYFSDESVENVRLLLKSITAESSFLIRTFFFVIFGYNIDIAFIQDQQVIFVGSLIVLGLLGLRYVYLRILHQYSLLPELLYIPRGLITILLFYKIPEWQRIDAFDEGVLFFVILATGVIMMVGSLLYKDNPIEFNTSSLE
jgi:NhaP-type Na+/H+ or K+/H+ antiporter